MSKFLISIIIPCYNEKNTIEILIDKIKKISEIDKQIILIDDCSNDGTREIIKEKLSKLVDETIYHEKNLGKGACIKSAKSFVKGDVIIIQDADLEYSPNDYFKLIEPIKKNLSLVVYGSRVLGKKRYSNNEGFTSSVRIFANHVLTLISNFFNKQNLTDAHTCYKVFHKSVFNKINLLENDFSFCPEITTKVSRIGEKIIEIPVYYKGRKYSEGKKIGFFDGFKAIYVILKYNFFSNKINPLK